jgi:ABC-type thiamine transport system substrate-binding protein
VIRYGKIWKKRKLNSDKIWKAWKKNKLNIEMIWKIWKKTWKRYEKYGTNPS